MGARNSGGGGGGGGDLKKENKVTFIDWKIVATLSS